MINNQMNNVQFGARVKFSTNDYLKDLQHLPKFKTVEKMFAQQTKGIKGDLNVDLYTQGRRPRSLCTSVYYKNGKHEDSFRDMEDGIFFDANAKPQKMVNKLKSILNVFEERKNLTEMITKKEKEIKSIRNQMDKTAEKKGLYK